MQLKSLLCPIVLAACSAAACLSVPSAARADENGRYYHWPSGGFHQYRWTPYEYEQVYDGNYRYPKEQRRFAQKGGWRNWSTVKKPYYRGYHFILDQF